MNSLVIKAKQNTSFFCGMLLYSGLFCYKDKNVLHVHTYTQSGSQKGCVVLVTPVGLLLSGGQCHKQDRGPP